MLTAVVFVLAMASAARAAAPADDNCGVPSVTPNMERIVGGEEAKQYSWPWMVQMRISNSLSCGASLIAENWLLTAAHCVNGQTASRITFRAGRHSTSGTNEPYEQTASVKKIVMHEDYKPFTLANDVAVVQLSTSFRFNNYVKAVCLPSRKTTLETGTNVYVTGWGTLSSGGSLPKNLMQVQLPIFDRDTCNSRQYYDGKIKTGMICAGFAAGGKDSCQGDSGGPLVAKIGDQWEQYGVVSWGEGCARAYRPGVYTDVVYFNSWIRQKVTQVEREEAEVANKFKPIPFGAAFREMAKEMVESGEINAEDLPNADAWM